MQTQSILALSEFRVILYPRNVYYRYTHRFLVPDCLILRKTMISNKYVWSFLLVSRWHTKCYIEVETNRKGGV